VVTGDWKKNDNGTWTFTDASGDPYINKWAAVTNPYADATKGQDAYDWFFFDEAGNMITGWHQDTDGSWYFLNNVSDGTLGKMFTGWQEIEGKWYYFNEVSNGTRGALITDTWIGEYHVNSNGEWDNP
jgi:glucan-binding YG repeat protein